MSRPYSDESVYRAVAHLARRRMLDLLRVRERSAGEIIDSFSMNRQTASHHLRVLRSTGLVTARRKGKQRVYALDPTRLREIQRWLKFYESHLTSSKPKSNPHTKGA